MRTIIATLFLASLLFASCGNNQSKNESNQDNKDSKVKILDKEKLEKAKDCDEFIDQYEKWMDDYLKLIEKFAKNPLDSKLSKEFMIVGQEAGNWVAQWSSKMHCTTNEKYQKRFDEISAKADKKLKELGLE